MVPALERTSMEDTERQYKVGDAVQRLFKYKEPIDQCEGERMWVVLTAVAPAGCVTPADGWLLTGKLDNDPLAIDYLKAGDTIEFHSQEVIDLIHSSDYDKLCEQGGPGQLSMIDGDELGSRRKTKTQGEVLAEMGQEIMNSEHVKEFGEWLVKSMPGHEFTHHAHTFCGGIVGHIIDTWLQSGCEPEMLKEYFTRFVDMQVKQHAWAEKLVPPCDHT